MTYTEILNALLISLQSLKDGDKSSTLNLHQTSYNPKEQHPQQRDQCGTFKMSSFLTLPFVFSMKSQSTQPKQLAGLQVVTCRKSCVCVFAPGIALPHCRMEEQHESE